MFSDIFKIFFFILAYFFLYIVLIWQLVNTVHFVMLACVTANPRYFVPRAPLHSTTNSE